MKKRIVIAGLLSGLLIVGPVWAKKVNTVKLPSWAEKIIKKKVRANGRKQIQELLLNDLVGGIRELSKKNFEKANTKEEVRSVALKMMSDALKTIETRFLMGGKGPMSRYFTKKQLMKIVRPVVKKYRNERLENIELFSLDEEK